MAEIPSCGRPVASALLTDLYQLTMAYAYWRTGALRKEAVFHLSFRHAPFGSGYAIAAGLADAVEWLRQLHFAEDDIRYLRTLAGNDGQPLFSGEFLEYLRQFRFTCDVDAIPEGTLVFAHEPLVRVSGPILEVQIVETALLTFINFQTLVSTKAARICQITGSEPVLEFGLRRAQGVDGALAASRAAFIGGCAATSNVLAGKLFGIPVRGTHAHSWVMAFDDESDSFESYANALPNNCVFLVDTYDTLEGVRRAIEVGERLRSRGYRMIGIRLDSGDLAFLSTEARQLLDRAGFVDATIFASNDLDEHIIQSLKSQGAPIGVWGVGTKLVTAYDQPALGGVYKLGAVREPGSAWKFKLKVSDQPAKVSIPGILQVRRFRQRGVMIGDMIYNQETAFTSGPSILVDPNHATRRKQIPAEAAAEDLLVPVFRAGHLVYDEPSLPAIQDRAREQLASLHSGIKRLLNPHAYPVGLDPELFDLRMKLILQHRPVSG